MSADTALAAEPPTQGQGASFTYDAFLSYSHQDGAVAAGIQKGLHLQEAVTDRIREGREAALLPRSNLLRTGCGPAPGADCQ